MRAPRGVVLVAALLVLAAVLVMVAGALFAAGLSLREAKNMQARAVAEASADAGVELALRGLETAVVADDRLPDALALVVVPGYDYRLLSYRRFSDREAVLAVEGRLGAAASVVEALVAVEAGRPPRLLLLSRR